MEKTALQQLIYKLECFSDELDEKYDGDPLVKRGITISISEAKKLLPAERDAIAKAWDDGFVTGCVVGGNDYPNGTSDDTGEQYYETMYGSLK